MDDDEPMSVVIDNGSGIIKAGLAEVDIPALRFPCIGYPGEYDETTDKNGLLSCHNGHSRHEEDGIAPIQNGIITHWEAMEDVWRATFRKLNLSTETFPLVISDVPTNPTVNREKMTQVLFETYHVPQLMIQPCGILAHMSYGRGSTFIVDIGHSTAYTYAISDGNVLNNCIRRFDVTGHDLTLYLKTLLQKRRYSFATKSEIRMLQQLKERSIYSQIPGDKPAGISTHAMSNGTSIDMKEEKYLCAEAFFQPQQSGMGNYPGIHEVIQSAIMATDIDIRPILLNNICLSGGTTNMKGFAERLEFELKKVFPKARVVPSHERLDVVWIGGCIVGSMHNSENYFMHLKEYQEYGPSLVLRKRPPCPFF